jgi:hypothetical protein
MLETQANVFFCFVQQHISAQICQFQVIGKNIQTMTEFYGITIILCV